MRNKISRFLLTVSSICWDQAHGVQITNRLLRLTNPNEEGEIVVLRSTGFSSLNNHMEVSHD
jgi:hypothetical protein